MKLVIGLTMVGFATCLLGCTKNSNGNTPSVGVNHPEKHRSEHQKMIEKYEKCCKSITPFDIYAEKAFELVDDENVVFIDERESKEQDVSMIKGAVRSSSVTNYSKDKIYVVYCTIGYRSGSLTKKLRQEGKTAFNLVGGIYEWTYYNGDIVDVKGKVTKKVHVYSKDWDYLRPDYEAVR